MAGAGHHSYRVAAARGCFGAKFSRKPGQIPADGEAGARQHLPEGKGQALVHVPEGVRQVVQQQVLQGDAVGVGRLPAVGAEPVGQGRAAVEAGVLGGRAATTGRFQGLGGHHRRQVRGVVEGHKR